MFTNCKIFHFVRLGDSVYIVRGFGCVEERRLVVFNNLNVNLSTKMTMIKNNNYKIAFRF